MLFVDTNILLDSFYSDENVRERSVVEVTSAIAFDPNHSALPNGLYDSRMGPVERSEPPCITCALSHADCPGHAGHVELSVPVHHPLLLDELIAILRCKCMHCHRFRAASRPCTIQAAKFQLLKSNRLSELSQFDVHLSWAMHDARETGDAAASTKAASTRAATNAVDNILRNILKDSIPPTTDTNNNNWSSRTTYHKQLYTTLVKETAALLRSSVRCSHCGAYSPKIRHDSHNKLFQVALSNKMQRLNAAENATLCSAMQKKTTSNDDDDNVITKDTNDYDSDDTRRESDRNNDGVVENSDPDDNDDDDESSASPTKRDKYMHTAEVQAQLQRLWAAEPFLCHVLFGAHEKYVLQAVPVPPNRFRPPMHLNGMAVEHSQTAYLGKILIHNATVRDKLADSDMAGAYIAWIALQTAVNCYMDSSKDPAAAVQQVAAGIRQILERKEGLFRKNMMGKRVDYACRSVISPDPYVGTNEIGLPLYFATVLTYPTPVIERNVAEMRILVERGPHHYPGARWVQVAGKRKVDLSKMNVHQRQAMAAQLLQHVRKNGGRPVMVGRQLRDGDYVLMNRQVCSPTSDSLVPSCRACTLCMTSTLYIVYDEYSVLA